MIEELRLQEHQLEKLSGETRRFDLFVYFRRPWINEGKSLLSAVVQNEWTAGCVSDDGELRTVAMRG